MNDLFLRSHTMCRGANAICSAIWDLDTGHWGFSDGRQRCLKAPLLLLLILRWWDDWDDETGDARKLMMTMQSKKRGGCSKNKYLPSGMKARGPLKISRTLLVISLSSSPLQMQILGLERAPICTQSSAPLVPWLTILTDGLPHVELITIRLPIQSSTLSSSEPMSSSSSPLTSPLPLDASYTISFSNNLWSEFGQRWSHQNPLWPPPCKVWCQRCWRVMPGCKCTKWWIWIFPIWDFGMTGSNRAAWKAITWNWNFST